MSFIREWETGQTYQSTRGRLPLHACGAWEG